mgnify:CR=1 FL=1
MSTGSGLAGRKCTPCEGGTPPLPPDAVPGLLAQVPGWSLAPDGKRIRREWVVTDFAAGLEFVNRVGAVAEAEDHHPDLHLTGYRKVAVELTTHAANGLTENDFILAAKIDAVPVAVTG